MIRRNLHSFHEVHIQHYLYFSKAKRVCWSLWRMYSWSYPSTKECFKEMFSRLYMFAVPKFINQYFPGRRLCWRGFLKSNGRLAELRFFLGPLWTSIAVLKQEVNKLNICQMKQFVSKAVDVLTFIMLIFYLKPFFRYLLHKKFKK